MRECHILDGTKSTEMPSIIIFYDTETNIAPFDTGMKLHKLKLGVACKTFIKYPDFKTNDTYYDFTTPEDFWNIVLGSKYPKKRIYIISHNQHFDFNVVNGWEKLASLKVTI